MSDACATTAGPEAALAAIDAAMAGMELPMPHERRTCCAARRGSALRRRLEAQEEAQMWARGDFNVRAPRHVGDLLGEAFRAARAAAARWLTPGECLLLMSQHFLETWEPAVAQRNTPRRRVLERDLGLCQVPGCSRPAEHDHHVVFRSQGGSDDPSNQTAVCAVHHLRGLHQGYIRVFGKAPDGLKWELGVRPRAGPDAGAAARAAERREAG